MAIHSNIFLNKKILIYGLGKSGFSTFKFLNNKSNIFLYDDYKTKIKKPYLEKKIISYKNLLKTKFDQIILSPGININNCKLTKFLKKNKNKIYSDLDILYSFYKNDYITITGTNGKSTTCQLLHDVLKKKFDVKLIGNIGNPVLSVKKVKKKTIFVIEASSYQLEYSKIFKSKYAAILNLSSDHIERHRNLNNYIKAKFKLLKTQSKGDFAFIKKNDLLIRKELKLNIIKSKIIKVNYKKIDKFLRLADNVYFFNDANKENLSFVLEISKIFKIKNNLLIKVIQNFKGLKYRQQIIYNRKNLKIINDSKSTSFASSLGILKEDSNLYWLLGGIYKKGDRFNLSNKYFKNIQAYIYGKNKKFFIQELENKIKYRNFANLEIALKNVLSDIKKQKLKNKVILFSPSAASFDSFKNFEDRGSYFNKLIKKYLNGKQKINI